MTVFFIFNIFYTYLILILSVNWIFEEKKFLLKNDRYGGHVQ